MVIYNPFTVTQINNDHESLVLFFPETNVEPFPTFDIEINKEDKDSDIDHPEVEKDPSIDKDKEDEPPHPDSEE